MCREGKLRLYKNGGWTANKRTIGGKKKHHSPKEKKKNCMCRELKMRKSIHKETSEKIKDVQIFSKSVNKILSTLY